MPFLKLTPLTEEVLGINKYFFGVSSCFVSVVMVSLSHSK